YLNKSIDTYHLLRWSKLLDYDFFRIYTQHLILYAPRAGENKSGKTIKSSLPKFKKNGYNPVIIDYITEQISSNEMTKAEVIEQYNIPKTTLYKWIKKHTT